MIASDPEHIIASLLPGGERSENKRLALAKTIARELEEAGLLIWDLGAVEVNGGRVPVETVEAYGLVIEVDTVGNAVSVTSPWGFCTQP